MCEGVLDGDALVGVEGEQLVEQVDQLGTGGAGEELLPRHLGPLRQRPQEVPSLFHQLIWLINQSDNTFYFQSIGFCKVLIVCN